MKPRASPSLVTFCGRDGEAWCLGLWLPCVCQTPGGGGGQVAPWPLCWPCSSPCPSRCWGALRQPRGSETSPTCLGLASKSYFCSAEQADECLTGGGHKESSQEQKPSPLSPCTFQTFSSLKVSQHRASRSQGTYPKLGPCHPICTIPPPSWCRSDICVPISAPDSASHAKPQGNVAPGISSIRAGRKPPRVRRQAGRQAAGFSPHAC